MKSIIWMLLLIPLGVKADRMILPVEHGGERNVTTWLDTQSIKYMNLPSNNNRAVSFTLVSSEGRNSFMGFDCTGKTWYLRREEDNEMVGPLPMSGSPYFDKYFDFLCAGEKGGVQ